ncbi:hypothetical protein AB0M91_20355 [Micromonospora rifamycinica]|uniref:SCO6745 family protein n=1 Tax=Micromonospora rifamycinica TaxID=291594 RepID=UPI0033C74403
MTPEQVAAGSKPAVLELGELFSRSPETLQRARELGLSGWAFYVTGRAGALGDIHAETVAAALGFLAPEAVADGWDTAVRVVRPLAVATANLTECCRWGTAHLDGLPGTPRLTALLERVVAAADATGMPLFAAWRAMPLPEHADGARVAAALLLLREHFAGAYLLAVRAAGLTPLEAVLAGPAGEGGAAACGWSPPYPAIGPLVRRRLWAEAVTDRLASTGFRALRPAEGRELIELLSDLRARLRPDPAG